MYAGRLDTRLEPRDPVMLALARADHGLANYRLIAAIKVFKGVRDPFRPGVGKDWLARN